MVRSVAYMFLMMAGLVGCSEGAPTAVGDHVRAHSSAAAVAGSPAQLPIDHRSVRGNGTKGPLLDATVELFALDSQGFALGEAFASTVTDEQGNWQLEVNRSDAVLVRISGGRYVDEADTNVESRRVIELSDQQFLESVLLPGGDSVAVTVFTQALLRKSRLETGFNDFLDVLEQNRELFVSAYGFDVMSTLPANPLAPIGSDEAIAYALNVGGVANAINALSIASNSALPEYAHIVSVVEDLIDCRLDGIGVAGQSVLNVEESGYGNLSLEQQTIRFRNNNFSNYANTEPPPINAESCLQLGGSADATPPQFSTTAQSPRIEAQSMIGAQLDDVQKQALINQFSATDDRAGVVRLTIDIPTQVPLGPTVLQAVAEDAWGNRTTIDWTLLVSDTTAPQIDGVADVSTDAQGDFTELTLEPPSVSDLVSSTAQIDLVNNAPALFAVGTTEVVWTASDAAGNSAEFVQTVTVNSVPPEISATPPAISTGAGDVDFSEYFFDPDGTTLTYSIDGLPVGTGLSLDPTTGVLTGEPTAADLAAQPLTVTISATDGQNTANVQTTLTVVAPNVPPAFALEFTEVSYAEDFGTRTINIEPLEVPPNEQDQVVTYSVTLLSPLSAESPVDVTYNAVTRRLVVTSLDNAYGIASYALTANDGQTDNNEFQQTFTIDVTPVNDVPEVIPSATVDVVVGQDVSVMLANRVIDVEDDALLFEAEQLPAGLSLNDQVISGVALPADALSVELPIRVRATDSDGAGVDLTVVLRVSDLDQDGDGLSDYMELQAGFDPLSVDSDGDGFGDSLEFDRDIDLATETVLFVGANGNDGLTGDSPQNALATLTEASARLAALAPDRAATVLLERLANNVGSVVLTGMRRSLIGDVDFTSLQRAPGGLSSATQPRLVSVQEPAVSLTNCQDCRVTSVRIETGQGMTIIDSAATLEAVQIVSTSGTDGGALYLLRSSVAAISMLIAANQAQQGGAISLQEQSVLDLRHALLTGNRANVAGGAASVFDSSLTAHNVWFIANAAPDAATIDALDADVTLTNVTFAYNLLESISGEQLMRCRTAFLSPCSGVNAFTVQDSLIASNRNLAQQTIDVAGVGVASAAVFVEPGRIGNGAVNLTAIEPFDGAFMSSDPATLNGGSRSSVEAALEMTFSQTNSVFTDRGVVDAGVHYEFPVRRISDFRPVARLRQPTDSSGLRAIDLRLLDTDQPLREMRRLKVSVLSDDARSQAVSTGVLPSPLALGRLAVPAIHLGQEHYRIWVTETFDPGRDRLTLWLDDDQEGVDVSVVCEQALCGGINVTGDDASFHGGGGLGTERITPAVQPVSSGG